MIGVTALALSPDGRFVASGDGVGQVRVWDLAEKREVPTVVPPPHQRADHAARLPAGQGQAVPGSSRSASDGQGMLWDTTGPC